MAVYTMEFQGFKGLKMMMMMIQPVLLIRVWVAPEVQSNNAPVYSDHLVAFLNLWAKQGVVMLMMVMMMLPPVDQAALSLTKQGLVTLTLP